MALTPKEKEQVQEAGVLAVLAFAVASPLCWMDNKLGLLAAFSAAGATLYALHEKGKESRQTILGSRNGLFSTETARNLAAGAAEVIKLP